MCDVTAVKFQNTLQIARATKGAECTLEQHVIINRMNKHEKALAHVHTTPPFMILTCIAKELADAMQVWTLNESACPEAVRQFPDHTLHLHDVDFLLSAIPERTQNHTETQKHRKIGINYILGTQKPEPWKLKSNSILTFARPLIYYS